MQLRIARNLAKVKGYGHDQAFLSNTLPKGLSRQHMIVRMHAGLQVITDVAMKHPGPRIVRNHDGDHHLRRHQGYDIGSFIILEDLVAVPVGSAEVGPVG